MMACHKLLAANEIVCVKVLLGYFNGPAWWSSLANVCRQPEHHLLLAVITRHKQPASPWCIAWASKSLL